MITRDSRLPSLWQDTVDSFNSTVTNSDAGNYDVLIVGGGITGITTALMLQQSGKNCLLLEAEELGYGTTGGTTAHLNTLLDTPYTTISKNFGKEAAKTVARATAEAIQLVKGNVAKYNIDCGFADAAAYLYAENEDQDKELRDIFEATVEAGVSANMISELPIPAMFTSVMRAEGQAKFHPLKYILVLAAEFEKAGGKIIQHCRVTNVEDGANVTVETAVGSFSAKDLIYATHIPPGINLLHLRCAPYRSYVMAGTLDDDNYPEDLVYDMYDPYFYYRTHEVDGQKMLIVGGKDHKTGHEENTFRNYLQLEAKIKSLYPSFHLTHQWSSEFFEPADGLPYIGHLPQHTGHIHVATGFGGNGMVYSHISAMILTDMLTGKESRYGDLFNPKRIKPIAGFTNFIRHNADVTKEFLGKLFSAEKLTELSDLAAGEGKLVSFEGKKLGIYKAESGEITAVNPICTHMKCDVKWNTSERSWDCPCHGGRFDCYGKVLTGPPSHDLEQISIEQLINK